MKDSSKEKKKEMVCIPECRGDNGRRSKILQRAVIKVFKREGSMGDHRNIARNIKAKSMAIGIYLK